MSGGKDSVALWHALISLGYTPHALHLQLGISKYSENSLRECRRFAEKFDVPLDVVFLEKESSITIPLIKEKTSIRICGACGTAKRYWYNRYALKNKHDVIVTGHNGDDLASQLFHAVKSWNIPSMLSTYPVREGRGSLVKRAKPLVYLTEKETMVYVLSNQLPVHLEECPLAQGAWSITEKEMLNSMEERQPGFKYRFLTEFYKHAFPKLTNNAKQENVRNAFQECIQCGMPSAKELCSYCRLVETTNRAR